MDKRCRCRNCWAKMLPEDRLIPLTEDFTSGPMDHLNTKLEIKSHTAIKSMTCSEIFFMTVKGVVAPLLLCAEVYYQLHRGHTNISV